MRNVIITSLLTLILLSTIIYGFNRKGGTSVGGERFNDRKKKIISFSLWGDKKCYNYGALENAILAKKIYPGWICRFYLGEGVIPKIVENLKKMENVELVFMKNDENMRNRHSSDMWRFDPLFEEDVEIVIARDTDSQISMREKVAVDEWLKSGKKFHIMRDHKYHGIKYLPGRILSGMFGARDGYLRSTKNLYDSMKNNAFKYGNDMKFLDKIYDFVKNDMIVHDTHSHYKYENPLKFSVDPINGNTVGSYQCRNFPNANKILN